MEAYKTSHDISPELRKNKEMSDDEDKRNGGEIQKIQHNK